MDSLLLRGLDEKVDPHHEHCGFKQRDEERVETELPEAEPEKWRQDGGDDHERQKQIERLERIETHFGISAILLGSQEDDGRNNPENGDVAQHRSRTVTEMIERVNIIGLFRLGSATSVAEGCLAVHLCSAMGAVGQSLSRKSSNTDYVTGSDLVPDLRWAPSGLPAHPEEVKTDIRPRYGQLGCEYIPVAR